MNYPELVVQVCEKFGGTPEKVGSTGGVYVFFSVRTIMLGFGEV